MLTTPFCRGLEIEHPVFSVGFGAGAGPELAAAVSNAGGCGVLGSSSLPPEEMRARIRRTRGLTSKPFGANVVLAAVELGNPEVAKKVEERIAAICEEAVPLLVFFWGDAAPYVEEAHRRGTKVLIQVGSVDEAERAAAAGVDAVIAQGIEAGGHVRARDSLWVNLPAIVDAVSPLPVLASGGIADGRGLAAALALGAQGVSLGTRFVASEEAYVPAAYKQRLVDAAASDTVYSEFLFDGGWPDAPHRVLRNRSVEEWEAAGRPPSGERPGEGEPIGRLKLAGAAHELVRYSAFMTTPDFDGDIEHAPLWAGQSVSLVNDIKPAGEIVRDLVRQAEEALGPIRET